MLIFLNSTQKKFKEDLHTFADLTYKQKVQIFFKSINANQAFKRALITELEHPSEFQADKDTYEDELTKLIGKPYHRYKAKYLILLRPGIKSRNAIWPFEIVTKITISEYQYFEIHIVNNIYPERIQHILDSYFQGIHYFTKLNYPSETIHVKKIWKIKSDDFDHRKGTKDELHIYYMSFPLVNSFNRINNIYYQKIKHKLILLCQNLLNLQSLIKTQKYFMKHLVFQMKELLNLKR